MTRVDKLITSMTKGVLSYLGTPRVITAVNVNLSDVERDGLRERRHNQKGFDD